MAAVCLADRKNKGAAVRVAPASGVPVPVGHRAEPRVLRCEAFEGRVDRLLLRADEADLEVALLEGEDLRAEHRRVRDADKLELPLFRDRPGDDEEPGAVGRAVDLRRLYLPVDLFLFLGQVVEVHLRRRGEGFYNIFKGISIYPVKEVEDLDRDLRVRQEEGVDVPLAQVFRHRVVVREVAVVDEGLVEAGERVCPAGVPDAPLGRIALVGDPDVRLEGLQLVVLGDLLRVPDDLEDHHIPAVGEDKSPFFAQRAVIGPVEKEGVLVDELFLDLFRRQIQQAPLCGEALKDIGLHPHEVAPDGRGLHLQTRHVPVVVYRLYERLVVHPEVRPDIFLFEVGQDRLVKEGDLEEEIVLQRLLIDPHPVGGKADGGDASALAVAPVVHLDGRLYDVPAAHGYVARKTRDPAPAFLRLANGPGGRLVLHPAPGVRYERAVRFLFHVTLLIEHPVYLPRLHVVHVDERVRAPNELRDAFHPEPGEQPG